MNDIVMNRVDMIKATILSFLQPLSKKYMRLSTQVTIGLIQRFLAAKLHLESENMVKDPTVNNDFVYYFF